MEPLYEANKLDGFCLYLYGIVLRDLTLMGMARTVFVESLRKYPCNWSCWQDLVPLCPDRDVIRQLALPVDHWTYQFFLAFLYLELQNTNESLKIYNQLNEALPNNTYILAQTALARYDLLEFDVAEKIFENLREIDPCRLTNMDTYSNILYVREAHAKLSHLAYEASVIDKYTPETCSIIGNYYSLKADHVKAVNYYQRALALNPQYLSAWTLMGHEYMELKNTTEAVNAYRRAVDTNPRDYRAWYGLGQTYELLSMPLYALYYFGKACKLRPYDSRMWCAAGECYQKVGNIEAAIKCYKRADCNNDREGMASLRLGTLLKIQGKFEEAAYYFKKNLDRRRKEGLPHEQESVNGLLFLAKHTKAKGWFKEAANYCNLLLDYTGKEKEEAKALLKELHSAQNS
uniref:Cdc23 domain-containing protein n=1 Tax=Arcella intermedia TaxID=1963864 RepID=A0A6B2L4M5_9EUKA